MQFIKFSIAIMISTSLFSSNALVEDDVRAPTTLPAHMLTVEGVQPLAQPVVSINGKNLLDLLKSDQLAAVMRTEPFPITATNEAGEAVTIPATRSVLLGFVMNVPTVDKPNQTITVCCARTATFGFDLSVGLTDFAGTDPRPDFMTRYIGNDPLQSPFVVTDKMIKTEPGSMFNNDGEIVMSSEQFDIKRTIIATPNAICLGIKGHPVISEILVKGRPFFGRAAEHTDVNVNLAVLDLSVGVDQTVEMKAGYVGRFRHNAVSIGFHPSIMPESDFRAYMAERAMQEEAARAAVTVVPEPVDA